MANIITVNYSEANDTFVVLVGATGKTVNIKSGVFHDKLYLGRETMKSYILSQFPDATGCNISSEAGERMDQIAEWNTIEDEW